MKLIINKSIKNFSFYALWSIFLILTLGPFFSLGLKGIHLPLADRDTWNFTHNTLVPGLLSQTFLLLIGTCFLSTLLGFTSAFIMSFSRLSSKKLLHLLFLLPLAFPIYVQSFIYVGLFEYAGTVPSFFREQFSINLNEFISIKSTLGVIFVFSLTLFPYSYLFIKRSFDNMKGQFLRTSQSLGLNFTQYFLKIVIPYSMPWILGPMAIISMETLSDFGGVSVFNYNTFTLAIYTAFTDLFSLASAARLSFYLLIFSLLFLTFEKKVLGNKKFNHSRKFHNQKVYALSAKWERIILWPLSFMIILFSLIIPFGQLSYWAFYALQTAGLGLFTPYLWNSFLFAIVGSFFILCASIFIFYSKRFMPNKFSTHLIPFTLMGYALPGTLIALAIYILFAYLLHAFDLSFAPGVSLLALFIGLMIRFLAVGHRGLAPALKMIPENHDHAAFSFGLSRLNTLFKIHLPQMKKEIYLSFGLVFIEIIKEMPLTLMLRPVGKDTLAVKIFEYTSEGEWIMASIPALFIILLAGLGSFCIFKMEDKSA